MGFGYAPSAKALGYFQSSAARTLNVTFESAPSVLIKLILPSQLSNLSGCEGLFGALIVCRLRLRFDLQDNVEQVAPLLAVDD